MLFDDEVRRTLKSIVAEHGRAVCNDPRRLEGLLKDLRREENKREINLLLSPILYAHR